MYKLNEEFFYEKLQELMNIDSTTGFYHPIQDYIESEIKKFGMVPETYHKGGIQTVIGGEGNTLLYTAHLDDIGLMVRKINSDGTLTVVKVGGLHEDSAIGENVKIYTRNNKVYTGCIQKVYSSVHVSEDDEYAQDLSWIKNVCVVLDEDVECPADVEKLGINVGDVIALDPRYTVSNGYIKSRFLDDKACAAVLLCIMKEVSEKKIKLNREVIAHFSVYEEIGHGTSVLPERVNDLVALDIACMGPRQTSHEKKVTILAQDTRFPYNYDLTTELYNTAKAAGIDAVLDIFTPHYGSDGDTSIVAGHDIRHAAIGQGTRNSHGYERNHIEGIRQLYALAMEFITG
ncbi:MAG: M42 family metallopeptidase [Lachnospiraceae bacterium]|nr:M42 family metallopeptidase [Lachnospiraceae bacterium]